MSPLAPISSGLVSAGVTALVTSPLYSDRKLATWVACAGLAAVVAGAWLALRSPASV